MHVLLATCLLEQGRQNAALSHLEQAQALDANEPATLLLLGQTYTRSRRYEDAIDAYLRVLELAPDNQEARQALEDLEWSGTTGGQ
jgi:tetratricopeptide (TPR) repeat protein